ncbi:fatty acid hydroxylase domain-containing protein 2-like [Cochliomyia hominivorax]
MTTPDFSERFQENWNLLGDHIQAIKLVLFNQLVVTPIALSVFNIAEYKFWTPEFIRQMPSLKTFLIKFAIMTGLEEVLFYYVHRLLHHRLMYTLYHKKHHKCTAPIAITTFYCHPVEHILSNFGPITLSGFLLNVHIIVFWAFSTVAIAASMTNHSGYYFPFAMDLVLFHDYHHERFNCNFGVFGWLDKFHGTFKETKFKRFQNEIEKSSNKLKSKIMSEF